MPSSVPVRLLLPSLVLVALTGCGDDAYYQSRSAPAGEDGYSTTSRWFWSEDESVYELPANPPAIVTEDEDAHRSRIVCRKPGQHFKGHTIATLGTESAGEPGRLAPSPMGSLAERSEAPGGPTTIPANTLAGWHDHAPRGALEKRDVPPVATLDRGPASQAASGVGRIPVQPMGSMDTDSGWCAPR